MGAHPAAAATSPTRRGLHRLAPAGAGSARPARPRCRSSGDARERNLIADQRIDTFIHMQNPAHRGDAGPLGAGRPQRHLRRDRRGRRRRAPSTDSTHRITVESTPVIADFKPTTANKIATITSRIRVSDGGSPSTPPAAPTPSSPTSTSCRSPAPLGVGATLARINFQPAGAPGPTATRTTAARPTPPPGATAGSARRPPPRCRSPARASTATPAPTSASTRSSRCSRLASTAGPLGVRRSRRHLRRAGRRGRRERDDRQQPPDRGRERRRR